MYISYGSTDPSIVRYFSKRVPRSLATTSGQFVIDSATVAAWSLTSPSSSRPAKVKFLAQAPYSAGQVLTVQLNLACAYQFLGRREQAIRMQREVYAGRLRLSGEEAFPTLLAANNLASSLARYRDSYGEAKTLWRTLIPIARRSLGEGNDLTLTLEINYARTLYEDTGATLDDLREAATTLEDTVRIVRRWLGPSHPTTEDVVRELQNARAALAARDVEALRVGAMRV